MANLFVFPDAPGHWLGLRRRVAKALLCEPLHERPHVLQLMEAAAERGEAPGILQIRGVCRQRDRTLFPDCHHDTELRRGVHPDGTARARLPDSSDRVLLLRLRQGWGTEPNRRRHSEGPVAVTVCAWPVRWTVGNFSIRVGTDGNTNEAGVWFGWGFFVSLFSFGLFSFSEDNQL